MRLLLTTEDRIESQRINRLLQENGIATMVRTTGPRFVFTARIFVVIDQQFDDAKALLTNPRHRVKTALPTEAINRINGAENLSYAPLLKPVLIALPIVLVVAAIALWLGLRG